LSLLLDGDALLFATAGIALGGATVLGLATQILETANDKNPPAAPASSSPLATTRTMPGATGDGAGLQQTSTGNR
jgi:hypothetical protein